MSIETLRRVMANYEEWDSERQELSKREESGKFPCPDEWQNSDDAAVNIMNEFATAARDILQGLQGLQGKVVDIEKLSVDFSAAMREYAGDNIDGIIAENRRRRAAGDYSTCASHDYFDANDVLLEALRRQGFDTFNGDDEGLVNACNTAWTRGIESDFRYGIPTCPECGCDDVVWITKRSHVFNKESSAWDLKGDLYEYGMECNECDHEWDEPLPDGLE